MRSASGSTAGPAPRPVADRPAGPLVADPAAAGRGAGPGSGAGRSRWLAAAIAAAGAGLIPWMVILAGSLPGSARAAHWGAAWVGLDALEALGLITTGLLLFGRDGRYCLTAAATAVLLLADAWLDTATAPPGREQLLAAGLALFAELPAAAVCGALAWSGSRPLWRSPARPLPASSASADSRARPVGSARARSCSGLRGP
jgi:hypothetical protein